MHHTNEERENTVTTTDRTANTPSTPKTGLFATLCAFLHINGIGAPKTGTGTGAPFAVTGAFKFSGPSPITWSDLARFAYNRSPRLPPAGAERRARGARARTRGARSPRAVAGLVSLCALFGALVFNSSAMAAGGHEFSSSFTGETTHTLSDPSGVAVNNATGNVYVVDKGNSRVEEFNPTGTEVIAEFKGAGTAGELSEPEAIAIDNSGATPAEDPSVGDLYVTGRVEVAGVAHGVLDKFEADGKYLGQITGTCENAAEVPPLCKAFAEFTTLKGVAVDPQGQLWVYQENKQIDAFSDAQPNAFLSGRESRAGGGSSELSRPVPGFAVNSEDDLYVAHGEEEVAITKLNGKGEELQGGLGGFSGKTGVAVESSSNDVYIDSGESGTPAIQEFSPEGKEIESFGVEQLVDRGGRALAVSYASVSKADVYVVDSAESKVDIFGTPLRLGVN
jgi:DNA-binding beta-propeller fold protein YncE